LLFFDGILFFYAAKLIGKWSMISFALQVTEDASGSFVNTSGGDEDPASGLSAFRRLD
jgi:hypothetical protein